MDCGFGTNSYRIRAMAAQIEQASHCFAFEQDFIGTWRCIPLCVRRKLDLIGLKLKLSHWLALEQPQRQELVQWGAGGGLLKLGGIALSEEELGALGRVVASNPGLTTIDMTDSNIGDAVVAAVAEALLSNHSSVTALGLSGNKIGDGGIGHIARLLEPGSALASLFLRNNSVGADGARELAAALKSNTCLLKLNLKNNALGEAGARELAGMLAHNTTLTELNVWDNQLGPGGARALADAVAEPGCRLLDLDLGCNQVGNLGVAALAVPLQGNASLTRLNLRWNEIDDEGLEVLAAALPTNTLLSELHLFGNSFSQDCSSVLAGKISSSLKVLK